MYCDNWETEFPEATFDTKLMQRAGVGITTRDPMKDLMDAYARLQYDDDDNADTESESTFVSHHQDKLHVIPGLDDYIMDCSGTVTHLGTHKKIHDTGDWMDDVKLPAKPLSSLQRRSFKHHLDTIDDLENEQEDQAPTDEPILPRTPPWAPSSGDPNRRSDSQEPSHDSKNPFDEPILPRTPPWAPSSGDPNRRSDSQKPTDEPPPPRYPQPWPPYTGGVPPGRARMNQSFDEPIIPRTPPWVPSSGDPNRRANMERSLIQAPTLKPIRLAGPMDEAPPPRQPPHPPQLHVHVGDMNEQKTFIPDDNDEQDNDNFDDIHLPDNMATLQLKPISRVSSPPPTTTTTMTIKPTINVRKPYQETDEDEDFINGVNVDGDDVLRHPTLKHLVKKQSTTPPPTNKTSMIPRRVVTPQSNTSIKQSTRLQRPTVAATTKPVPMAKKHMHLQGTATGSRPGMLTTPRSRKNYGDGTELDDLDIIPQWRRHSLSFWKKENRLQGGVDPKRPWRHNMTRRRPTLIKLDEHPVKQEYNEMKYDPVRYCWQGNENNMLSFGDTTKSYRRPALISNMGHKSKQQAKQAGVVVGSMVFDPVQMCWKKTDTNDEEDKIFDRIEDLDATAAAHPQKYVTGGLGAKAYASLGNHALEFDLSRHVQHQMRQEEETHREQMDAWLHDDITKQDRCKHARMLYNM